MKLINKQTGEIATLTLSSNGEELLLMKNSEMVIRNVKLSDLEEWQDYEEPTGYWYIDFDGDVLGWAGENDEETDRKRQAIGNYFETKAEAEKAVEKLKAWKRLKDNYLVLKRLDVDGNTATYSITLSFSDYIECDGIMKDLDLLFGGEE